MRQAAEISTGSGGEYHVASYIVTCRPEDAAQVSEVLKTVAGVEVHGAQGGRLVVTAEAGAARELAAMVERLQLLPKIVDVAPVYHEYTSEHECSSEHQHSGESAGASADSWQPALAEAHGSGREETRE